MAKIALLFPGQGAQQLGMGVGLIARFPPAQAYFDRASSVLGYDLLKLCIEGPQERLDATSQSQPALFVHSVAALASLLDQKPETMASVVAVAGLSLGEYSGLCAAGVLDFEEGVRVVQERGAAMQAASEDEPSGMASLIGLSVEEVQAVCEEARQPGEILQVANLLCPGNIAISGEKSALNRVEEIALRRGATKVIPLSVAGAFHTDIMLPAVDRLKNVLSTISMRKSTVPIYSNVDAKPHSEPIEFQELLAKQVINPVLWEATLRNLLALGVDQFYEIGAGRVLAGTLKRTDRKVPCECVGD